MVSLKSGKIIVLCKITLLSDPVTYGTLEVMVDWHYSVFRLAPIVLVGTWTGLDVIVVPWLVP